MSMKNDLINHINTKVSAPNMEYSELIKSGADTLDKAFQPHKNTNEIISMNGEIDRIRALQESELKVFAQREQDRIAINVVNEKFKEKEEELNEIKFNLFTEGGTNLNGTEETFKQNLIRDFEKETGKTGFTIDDLKRNVDSYQLPMSEGLREKIKKLKDYEYKKTKVDNRILDNSELDELAYKHYDQYAMVGQDAKTFRDVFKNHSNSIMDVLMDQKNKKELEQLSGRDLDAEKMSKMVQDQLNKQNGNNNQNNSSQNTNVNTNGNINSGNINRSNSNKNTNNKVTNDNTDEDNDDNQIIIDGMTRKELIQLNNDRKTINNNLLNTDEKIKKGYELIKYGNPDSQRAMVQNILTVTGVDMLLREQGNLLLTKKIPPLIYRSDTPKSNYHKIHHYDGEYFISDLLSNANDGNILYMKLDGYKVDNMPKEVAEAYKIIKKFQYIEATKYNDIIDKSEDIVKDVNLLSTSQSIESNEEYKKYIDNGIKLKQVDSNLENNIAITEDGIFQNNNGEHWWLPDAETREKHQNGQDTIYTMSNNILSRLYGNTQLMPEIVYFLSTSDSVIETRNKYFGTPERAKKTITMLKNPKEAKKLVDEMRDALEKAKQNLKIPNGINVPKFGDLAQMICLVDSSILPNHDHFWQNPASLGKVYATIQNSTNPNNVANISNNIEK